MVERLKSRLARAREAAQSARGPKSDPRLDAPKVLETSSSGQLPGWIQVAPFVLSRIVQRSNPLPKYLDLRPYLSSPQRKAIPEQVRGYPIDDSLIRLFPLERILFLDLETTGLSGGAGTIAFLAGLGRVVSKQGTNGFEIRQFLLSDYPGESAFLDSVLDAIKPDTVLASYNGRSFDEPLLRTRCVLNRKNWPKHLHLDFLPAARRLWRKRFPDCSLGTLETQMLGRKRCLDVPGARIPEIWFEYSKQGYHPLMEAVLEHNVADVESLAEIAAMCARVHTNPEEARDCDSTSLGSLWLKLEPNIGLFLLERAFAEGDQKAGWILLHHFRRNGQLGDYRRILGALSPSWLAWIEKAKDAEHRLRDPLKALEAALTAVPFTEKSKLREALKNRILRLNKKLEVKPPRGGHTIPPR